jgi:hypothetical protein
MNRRIISLLAAILLALAGLTLIAISLFPFETLKGLGDHLMPDGNLTILKAHNVGVFRILLDAAGSVLLGAAFVVAYGRVGAVRDLLLRYLADAALFFRSLRPARSDAAPLLALALILIFGALFRLVYLGDVMTHDESYTYVTFSSTSLFNIVTNYHLPNNHVLNSLLIFFSTRLFGIEPWAVRLPALLAGLLLIPAAYGLGRSIYDRDTGLAAALLVALLPGAVEYSTTGRGYSLVALFSALALWLASYLRSNRNRFAWSLLVLCCALGFFSVPVMLFPFGAVFAWLFLDGLIAGPGPYDSRLNALKYWVIAGLAAAILVLLLYTPIFVVTGAEKVFANPWVLPRGWNNYFPHLPGFLNDVWDNWTSGLPAVLTWSLVAGLVVSLVLHRRIAGRGFPLQLAALIWLGFLFALRRPQLDAKISVSFQAPVMVWCAAGIVGPLKSWILGFARKLPASVVVVGIAILFTGIAALRSIPAIPERWSRIGPAEQTVIYLKDRIGPSDLIIIKSPFDSAVWYYSALHGVGDDKRFDQRRPFENLYVIVSRGQTLESVLAVRGPAAELFDLQAARLLVNIQILDTYVVPHR